MPPSWSPCAAAWGCGGAAPGVGLERHEGFRGSWMGPLPYATRTDPCNKVPPCNTLPERPKMPCSRLVIGSTLRLHRNRMGEARCLRLRMNRATLDDVVVLVAMEF